MPVIAGCCSALVLHMPLLELQAAWQTIVYDVSGIQNVEKFMYVLCVFSRRSFLRVISAFLIYVPLSVKLAVLEYNAIIFSICIDLIWCLRS
jgi:hypothetical protein